MAIPIVHGVPTLFFRREAYERAGINRVTLDAQLGLTDNEFRVEGDLVAVGPIYDAEAMSVLIGQLEESGLVYYDDFFEMSGSWPEWLNVLAMPTRA